MGNTIQMFDPSIYNGTNFLVPVLYGSGDTSWQKSAIILKNSNEASLKFNFYELEKTYKIVRKKHLKCIESQCSMYILPSFFLDMNTLCVLISGTYKIKNRNTILGISVNTARPRCNASKVLCKHKMHLSFGIVWFINLVYKYLLPFSANAMCSFNICLSKNQI